MYRDTDQRIADYKARIKELEMALAVLIDTVGGEFEALQQARKVLEGSK